MNEKAYPAGEHVAGDNLELGGIRISKEGKMTRAEANVKAREIISKYTDMNEKLYKKAKEEGRAGIGLGKDDPEIIAIKKECGQRLKELKELYEKMNK